MSQSEYNTNCQRQKTRISVQHLKILHSDSRSPNVAAVFFFGRKEANLSRQSQIHFNEWQKFEPQMAVERKE
jgi:hypothetical protein